LGFLKAIQDLNFNDFVNKKASIKKIKFLKAMAKKPEQRVSYLTFKS